MRVGLFFSAAAMSGAFSGLLAAAIMQMDGLRGMRGWQWIFLVEGVATIVYGFALAAILPNTIRDVRLLSTDESAFCIKRLEADGSAKEGKGFDAKAFRSTFLSPHIWILCLALFCNGVSLFGLANFADTLEVVGLHKASLRFTRDIVQLPRVHTLTLFASLASVSTLEKLFPNLEHLSSEHAFDAEGLKYEQIRTLNAA